MTLAALIIADDEGFAGTAIKGEGSLFGMTLIEYQARLAAKAGATHIIICSAQVPAALVAALDGLRADDMNTALVRSAREAADSIHPEEAVLLIAPHSLPSQQLLRQLANLQTNAIVVSPLQAMAPSRELIDAQHDWAGLARIEGKLVRHTASMLGEWALGSTLLRIAVQAGAERVLVDPDRGLVVDTVINRNDCQAAEQKLVSGPASGFFGRAGALAARGFAASPVSTKVIAVLPLALLATALLSVVTGWTKMGLFAFALSRLPGMGAQRLVDASLQPSLPMRMFWMAEPWIGRAILLVAAYAQYLSGVGWGSLVLALWLVWSLWDRRDKFGKWPVSEAGAVGILLVAALAGYPVWGLGIAIAYVIGPDIFAKLRPELTKTG